MLKIIKNLLLIFPIVLLISCSDIKEDTKICYIDPDFYDMYNDMNFEKFIEDRISTWKCKRNDILVIRSYSTKPSREFTKYFSNTIEQYCRLDREVITEKNSDDETIKLKCVLNSSDRRGIRYGLD